MTTMRDEEQFEKTMRLVCRLEDADIDYVRDTAEWIARCVTRVLALNPTTTAYEITPIVLDMSTRGRWRLMKPEIVAEQLALPIRQPTPTSTSTPTAPAPAPAIATAPATAGAERQGPA